ncbi:polysaccharide lyase 8 family protein [Actinocatenispora comari]|uniref:Lyase n=1 Tax=Actinocatenispora comari TaxID=2807577 RepID=A0A8J4AEQ7_9ACTN|nr:polysaccharide lyase 8 family protein [Actinocatenispora comari]GIL29280.1 lyase [Actinocatenispora comari]
MELSRRRALALGAAAVGAVGGASLLVPRPASAGDADEFETLRARWAALLTGGTVDPSDPDVARALSAVDDAADQVWQTMDTAAGAATPWPDLPLTATDGVNANACLNRLLTLAVAWATEGAARYGDDDVLAAVVGALDLVYRKRFNENAREVGNWWNWEIGCPKTLVQILVLLSGQVPADQLAGHLRVIGHFVPNAYRRTNYPSLAETGANRMDKAVIVALSGIVARDGDRIALARDGVSDVRDDGRYSIFQYVTSGDGFYRDGSFIQHDAIPYVGSYGAVLLDDISRLLLLLAGSSWAITDPNQNVVLDAVSASYAPFVTNGAMMDCVRGRAVSRQASSDHDAGHGIVNSVLLLAQGAPASYPARFRALAKGWLRRDTARPFLATATLPELAAAKAVLADRGVTPAPEPEYHRQFPHQDRIVHRRRDWSFTLGLSSDRIFRYECGNGENLHGWYTGDGMSYLYLADDLAQFSDGFWPTVDPYRLPGVTVGTEPRSDAVSNGTSGPLAFDAWVGGTSLDRYGVVGMAFTSYDRTITARKSWFLLDDAVVALGAGIGRAGDDHPVLSIVENRNLHAAGTNRLLVDGHRQPGDLGWQSRFARARWAHLDGVGGYVFGGDAVLHAERAERTGAWHDVNTGSDTAGDGDELTRRYLSLWFDHGTTPTDASYRYVLLPTASAAATARWAADPPVRVLANTAAVQAIQVARPQLTMAAFQAAGRAGRLATDGPAAVLVAVAGDRITVAVSDPSRTADTVRVTLPFPARRLVDAGPTVRLESSRPQAVLAVTVGGSGGATHTATLER